MALTGNFEGMQRLAENLRRLAEVPSQASTEAAKEISRELQQEFTQGTDSYGKPWKPLRPSTLKAGRHPPPLTATGDMKRGTTAKPMAHGGVQIEVGTPYGVFHQRGTRKMVARKILPEYAMPKKWSEILKRAVTKAIQKRLKK